MAINFENQVVLVTGGTRGLGREFSLCLGASGATVAVNSTTSDDAGVIDTITGSGGQAAHFAGLVEHPDSLVEAVVERFGRLDAIIHNAGFVRDKTLRKMTDDQWQEVIDVHLSAAFKLKCGAQMNVDDFLPLIIRHFSERFVAYESCIVDDGVESTKTFDDSLY